MIHDLLCHKNKIYNPEQFQIREVLKMAYFHAIYNQGQLNELYKKYDEALCAFLKSFDNIFTTNYDSNLEKSTEKIIYHIHGQFDKLSETYNEKSFRNQLQDKPIKGIPNEIEYRYLHSTALRHTVVIIRNTRLTNMRLPMRLLIKWQKDIRKRNL